MQFSMLHYADIRPYVERWIHPRTLIITSEHRVRQVRIGVTFQLCASALLVFGLLWSTYATGRFVSTRAAIKAQSATLRSVTNSRIDSMFSLLPNTNVDSNRLAAQDASKTIPSMSNLQNESTLVRMAQLEQQVHDLKNVNQEIVARVREKTEGRIEDLESIIRQTGLDLHDLKKQAEKNQKSARQKAEGGPYIPADMPQLAADTSEMFTSLDNLQALRRVVATLPLAMPIAGAEEQSSFGHRVDPINGHLAFHSGLDLSAATDSSITSAGDGTVIHTGYEGAYGNMIDIDHGNGIVTRYGHLSEIDVNEGDHVSKGTIIGVQGSTGRTTGPHLHYEVRYHDEPLNPKKFLEAGRAISKN